LQLDQYMTEALDTDARQALAEGQSVLFLGLQGLSKAYIAQLAYKQAMGQKYLIVTNNLLEAERYLDDLANFIPEDRLYLFNSAESVAADLAVASPEALADRLAVMKFLRESEEGGIILAPLFALKKRLMPAELWDSLHLELSLGDDLPAPQLAKDLLARGYKRRPIVASPGEMSLRGDIVDCFPLDRDQPVRFSLAFDELERISSFDPDNQKSLEDLDQVQIIPADDFLFQPEQMKAQADRLQEAVKQEVEGMADADLVQEIKENMAEEVNLWRTGESSELTAYFSQYLYESEDNLLSYLGDKSLLIIDDYPRLQESAVSIDENAAAFLQAKTEQGQLPPQITYYTSFKESLEAYKGRCLYLGIFQRGYGQMKFDYLHEFQTRPVVQFYEQMDALKMEIQAWQKTKRQVVIALSTADRRRKLEEILQAEGLAVVSSDLGQLQEDAVNLVLANFTAGIEFVNERLVLVSEADIYQQVKKKKRPKANKQLSNAERLKNYQQLEVGDYVVHINHGIGQFTGIETIEVAGSHRDYLTIVYADQAAIHVPVEQIDLVQKYVSSEGKTPKLNKMGGSEWAKTKRKVSGQIEDIADDLIEIYANREAQEGYAFGPDTPEQADFEAAFPYSETEDQLRSIDEIKTDMEKSKAMDRLLVGDVGFGKTEVAMRAIFKALMEGKQAAFLVPTTVLAQQHYETLLERFQDWPFEIALLSRFRTKAQQDQTIEGLASGRVNLVVGTHRLLSKDVSFLDLGLLVVDEEQRFGVKAKERLKQLKANVDVLTLTATPIPRTLHLSILGARDLSVIETPPANRYPVQTYILEQNPEAIREAIERELGRSGQVFYLFNNVQKIEEKALAISGLVPEARVGIAHGQMSVNQLEEVLMAFIEGDYDVLVTTTIIETGVDIPNVNTLLVESADRMGLSTLYQLRGRVGRSNRVAYAYFMYQPDKMLSEVSEKRLAALRDFTDLGSGFKIAMRDLAIRGAGNLLGKQQHGFVNSVGFDLYSQMLSEAVAKKRGQAPSQAEEPVELEMNINAYIPSTYIADEKQKLEIYKRINLLEDTEAMWDLDEELMDRFGEPPLEVQLLLNVGALKANAKKVGINHIQTRNNGVELHFHASLDQQTAVPKIFEALDKIPMRLQMKEDKEGQLTLFLQIGKLEPVEWLDYLLQFVSQLADQIDSPSDEES
ncbi:transcription-repair coupling factor, partial [Aerococcus sanguinicola]